MKPNHSPITMHSYDLCRAFGFLSPREVFALRTLAWSLPVNPVIVNIGVGSGTSALAFYESRPEAELYSVDISEGGPLGGMQNEHNAFDKVGLSDYYPIEILGDSKQVGKKWKTKESIDLLFVDGDHSYEGCYGDITSWSKNVKRGGIIAIHDYDSDTWPDVQRVVDTSDALKDFVPMIIVDSLYVARKK